MILAVGFCPRYHLHAIFMGVFHAVSSFNNAGFDLTGSSLVPFAQDPLLILTHAALIITGGLGYAVLLEIGARVRSPNHPWTLHARFVLMITAILLVVGTLGTLAIEWGNPHTLGQLAWPSKILDAFFQSVTARTAGFTSLDTGLMHPASQFLTIMLMFIGASPGSTGGGIKTTTFAIRGGPRRVPRARDGGAHRERLASPNILDVIDLAEDVSMLEFTATAPLAGKTLNELSLRRRFGITGPGDQARPDDELARGRRVPHRGGGHPRRRWQLGRVDEVRRLRRQVGAGGRPDRRSQRQRAQALGRPAPKAWPAPARPEGQRSGPMRRYETAGRVSTCRRTGALLHRVRPRLDHAVRPRSAAT